MGKKNLIKVLEKTSLYIFLIILFSCSKDVEEPVLFTLTVTANPTEGGTVSPTNGQYESGDVATVTATPNAEYVFEKWTGGVTGTSSSVSVTMNGNKSVVANFIKKQYPLTINIEGEGTVTETVIKQGLATDYNSGTIVELTAVPKDGWEFEEWSGDLTGSENPKQVTIDKAKTVNVKFKKITFSSTYVSSRLPFLLNTFSNVESKKNTELNKVDSPLMVNDNFFYDIQDFQGTNQWVNETNYIVNDFNNDGYIDAFFSFMSSEDEEKLPFKLYLFNGNTYEFEDKSNLIQNNIGQSFNRKTVSADLNGDDFMDFILVSHPELPEKELSFFDLVISNGDGTWSQKRLSSPNRFNDEGYYHGVAISDLDNDDDFDIVIAQWHNEDGMLSYINDGSGNFSVKKAILTENPSNFKWEKNSYTNELLYINDDNCVDLVYWVDNFTYVKFGNCDGTFGPITIDLGLNFSWDFKTVDLDSDNTKELIVYNNENPPVLNVFNILNDGASTSFENRLKIDFTSNTHYFDIKEIDNSNKYIITQSQLFSGIDDKNYLDGNISGYYPLEKVFILDSNYNSSSVSFPITTPIEKIEYDNNSKNLIWKVTLLPENPNPYLGPLTMENLRGNIVKWHLFYSNENFIDVNSNSVSKLTLKSSEIENQNLGKNLHEYKFPFSPSTKEDTFVRISYELDNGIINSLSYCIKLERN